MMTSPHRVVGDALGRRLGDFLGGSANADIRPRDWAWGAGVAVFVLAASVVALRHAQLDHRAPLPAIDPGLGMAVAVRPLADVGMSPAGTSEAGGKRAKSAKRRRSHATPSAWQRDPAVLPPDSVDPAPTSASTKAKKPRASKDGTAVDEAPPPEPETPTDPPPPEVDDEYDPDIGDRDPSELPAEDPTTPDTAEPADGEAPSENPGTPGGDAAGQGASEAAEGTGGSSGAGGPGDPLYDRAVAFYRARLVAWFSSRFRISGSHLTTDELSRYRIRVRIELSEERTIASYEVLSSDHPTFTKAAQATLDALRGQTLPPPPENYPSAVQRQLTVTFACTEDACD